MIDEIGSVDRPGSAADARWQFPAALSADHAIFLLILVATAARLAFADSVGLGEDGAYSAAMARHFSWSYFDHPPIHYWLLGATEWLTGSTAPFVLRLPFVLLSTGSTWLLFKLTELAFGARAGLWAAIGFSLSFFFLVLPLNVGPDGPLVFFLLAAAWLVARVLLVDAPRPNLVWTAAGLAGSGALLSKYSAVLFLGGVFAFLVSTPGKRRWLAEPGPWIGLTAAALVFAPAILWNWQHDWISFLFQGERALPEATGSLARVGVSLLGQIGYLSPYFMPLLAIALIRALVAGPRMPASWFFACLALFPIAIFTGLNFFQPGLPHWSMPGWLFTFPLLGAATAGLRPEALRFARRASAVTALSLVLLAGAFVAYVRAGHFDRPVAVLLKPKPHFGNDILREFFDWRDIQPILAKRGLLAGDTQFLAGLTWQTTARIDQVFGSDWPVLCVCATPNHFRFAANLSRYRGKSGLIVDRVDNFAATARLLDRAFERHELVARITLTRGGKPAIELRVERATGFRPGVVTAGW